MYLCCDNAAAILLFACSNSLCKSIISSSFAPYEKLILVLGGGVESSYFLLSLVVLVLLYLLWDLRGEPSKGEPVEMLTSSFPYLRGDCFWILERNFSDGSKPLSVFAEDMIIRVNQKSVLINAFNKYGFHYSFQM